MDDLNILNNRLAQCDEILADTLRMRFDLVEMITQHKQQNGISLVQPEEKTRQRAIIADKVSANNNSNSILAVYDEVLSQSKKVQSQQLFNCNIFLIGFMGAGKSTVSSALHNIFAMDVIEMDEIIAKRNGMSIPEIFKVHGEEYFRSEETKLLIESQSVKNMIISCGGGVPMREVNVQEMKKSGKVILLTAKPETILARVKSSHDRPLLENNKTVEYISELMEKRRPKYEAAADYIIETDGKSSREICQEIIDKIHQG